MNKEPELYSRQSVIPKTDILSEYNLFRGYIVFDGCWKGVLKLSVSISEGMHLFPESERLSKSRRLPDSAITSFVKQIWFKTFLSVVY